MNQTVSQNQNSNVENQFQLVASIIERDVLRYTPAGIPIVSAVLAHASKQMEAGFECSVQFEMAALAAGEITGRFAEAPLGACCQFRGFMTRRSRNSKSLVFHITEFDQVKQIAPFAD